MAGDASARVLPAAVPPPARGRWRVAPPPPGSAVGRGCRVSHQLAASRTSRADASVASVATAAAASGAAGRAATPGHAAAGDAGTPAADSWPDTLRLRRLTDELLPPPVATRLLALVRPTIDVVPADVDADLDAASSRIGGNPLLPPQLRWPHRDGAPLSFLAQVRLEEVAPYDVEGALPPSGLLLFFYGGAEDAWGFDPDDRLSWRVLLVDPAGARVRAAPTGAEVFTERGLRPQPPLGED